MSTEVDIDLLQDLRYDNARTRLMTHEADLIQEKTAKVKKSAYLGKYRAIRNDIYDILDHPMSSHSVPYHFGVFLFVLVSVILGAMTDQLETSWMKSLHLYMELLLAVFFLFEFGVRLWAVGADSKYRRFKGRIRYLCSLVGIIDIIIIFATLSILLIDKSYMSAQTMDYLRLVQILRLFHIDRQMTTWRLIRDMINISRWELFSAYYITFILFLLMANVVFYTEHMGHIQEFGIPSNDSDTISETFPTLAHAWWFSVVSILTIGYGDIVPKFWLSKVIVCILGFLAYCTFVTASTQISVGLTLMMEEDNKREYKKKLRKMAASVIQSWWRYQMATRFLCDRRFMTKYFKNVSYKMHLISEQQQKQQKRRDEKKLLRKSSRLDKKVRQLKSPSLTPLSTDVNDSWKSALKLNIAQQAIQPVGIDHKTVKKISFIQTFKPLDITIVDDSPGKDEYMYRRSSLGRRLSTDTTYSSFDGSDSEQPTIQMREILRENFSAYKIDVDEKLLIKYQPLLRFFNFLLFRDFCKRFSRLRTADRLIEIEAEIAEQELEKDKQLRELENHLSSIVGRQLKDNTGDVIPVMNRIHNCEGRLVQMQRKIDEIDNLVSQIATIMSVPQIPMDLTQFTTPSVSFATLQKQQSTVEENEEDFYLDAPATNID